jgi:hypothetical protein
MMSWEMQGVDSATMTIDPNFRQKIIEVCNDKIGKKGPSVGLSFYAFFQNRNDDPDLLMSVAKWWILTHRLDHFEKATKVKKMIEENK